MARQATGQVIEVRGKRGLTYAVRFRALDQRHYETLGAAKDGWTRRKRKPSYRTGLQTCDVASGYPKTLRPHRSHGRNPRSTCSPASGSRRGDTSGARAPSRTTSGRSPATYCRSSSTIGSLRSRSRRSTATRRSRCASARNATCRVRCATTRSTRRLLASGKYSKLPWNTDICRETPRGRRRRLKPSAPRRARLEAEQVTALLLAAGKHRALLATAIMAGGLRPSEVTAMLWQDVNLATARLFVPDSKTEAGRREVQLAPDLRDELAAHKAAAAFSEPGQYVFPTQRGTRRDRNSVRTRILYPAIEKAKCCARSGWASLDPTSCDVHFVAQDIRIAPRRNGG